MKILKKDCSLCKILLVHFVKLMYLGTNANPTFVTNPLYSTELMNKLVFFIIKIFLIPTWKAITNNINN